MKWLVCNSLVVLLHRESVRPTLTCLAAEGNNSPWGWLSCGEMTPCGDGCGVGQGGEPVAVCRVLGLVFPLGEPFQHSSVLGYALIRWLHFLFFYKCLLKLIKLAVTGN